ncbi:hypothetical protein [Amycolatopsis sacchari]|uniref:hypothetical protein n=1 Tax=Amycolatopsis sacchari TaxID=115433 RepID=UPI0011777217|nr:hypothetical protein [Amycolatopsis sacchari]
MKRLGKVLAFPLWRKLRWRIEQVTEQRHGPRFDELRRELDGLRGEVHTLREELRGHVEAITNRLDWHDNELKLMTPILSGLQTRVAELERPGVAEGDPRPALDEVRAEHARIRARLTAVAKYEERLARVEDTLSTRLGQ